MTTKYERKGKVPLRENSEQLTQNKHNNQNFRNNKKENEKTNSIVYQTPGHIQSTTANSGYVNLSSKCKSTSAKAPT
ncbi:hypothetical protein Leryth_013583 [Lithospermum erythrorhizon]|nr:hypothetical protein Leryth_013583 [Lithospermum erythrorhizon]